MKFDIRQKNAKVTEKTFFIKLLKSTSTMASGISKTKLLPSDLNELSDKLKLSLQEKIDGKISENINKEIVPIVDKLIE